MVRLKIKLNKHVRLEEIPRFVSHDITWLDFLTNPFKNSQIFYGSVLKFQWFKAQWFTIPLSDSTVVGAERKRSLLELFLTWLSLAVLIFSFVRQTGITELTLHYTYTLYLWCWRFYDKFSLSLSSSCLGNIHKHEVQQIICLLPTCFYIKYLPYSMVSKLMVLDDILSNSKLEEEAL